MINVVKENSNKNYTYLPYLWILTLKIKGIYLSLNNELKLQRYGRNGL